MLNSCNAIRLHVIRFRLVLELDNLAMDLFEETVNDELNCKFQLYEKAKATPTYASICQDKVVDVIVFILENKEVITLHLVKSLFPSL